jgi:hypothetical protein
MADPVTLGCWLGGSAVATIMGPFGTYDTMATVPRAGYFAAVLLASIIIAYLVRVIIAEWLPPMSRLRQEVLFAVLFAAVFTPFLQFVNGGLLGWNVGAEVNFGILFLFNGMVAATIVTLRRFMGFAFLTGWVQEMPRSFAADAVEVSAVPRLYERLEGAAGRVLRLTVDDHYVIVVLDGGARHRLLMRFADAVAEMAGQDGFLTHRSHWVSVDAVLRAVRVSGRDALELADGSVVPVSRTYRGEVLARGYLPVGEAMALASE